MNVYLVAFNWASKLTDDVFVTLDDHESPVVIIKADTPGLAVEQAVKEIEDMTGEEIHKEGLNNIHVYMLSDALGWHFAAKRRDVTVIERPGFAEESSEEESSEEDD